MVPNIVEEIPNQFQNLNQHDDRHSCEQAKGATQRRDEVIYLFRNSKF